MRDAFNDWQADNGHHVTETVDGHEVIDRDVTREADERYARTIGENILRGSLPDVNYDPERALWSLRAIIAVLDSERLRALEAVYAAKKNVRRRPRLCEDGRCAS